MAGSCGKKWAVSTHVLTRSLCLSLGEPPHEQWVPQHPARHHAPADQLGSLPGVQSEGVRLTPYGPADLHTVAVPRVRVAQLEHYCLSPVAHGIISAEPPVTMTSSVSLGFTLSQAGERMPGR